jgi:hypothetical protein
VHPHPLLVALLAIGMGGSSAWAQSTLRITPQALNVKIDVEDDAAFEALARSRSLLASDADKLRRVLKADPRTEALIKAVARAVSLKDPLARERALKALNGQFEMVRADAIRNSGIDAVAASTTASRGTLRYIPRAVLSQAVAPGSLISTVKISSFPKPYTAKKKCPDSSDRADFDGNTAHALASSAIADEDCWDLRAGRTASVKVPKGATSMKVVLKAHVNLSSYAMSLGIWAQSGGYVGIHVYDPSGNPFSEVVLAGKTIPIPATLHKLRTIHVEHPGPHPLPYRTAGFTDDLQEGDQGSTTTITLPAGVGPTLDISPVVGGYVDADLSGYASMSHSITPKGLEISFYR